MTTTSVSNPSGEQDVYAFPASFAQQRLWFLDQVNPQSAAYNLFSTVHISIPLNMEALKQSLDAIVQRHEALRTIFVVRDGQPMQMIVPHLKVPLLVADLEHLPEAQRETEMLRLANEEVQRPFDLAHGPLLRTMLFRLAAEEYLLLLTIHHIVFDGWSEKVFFRELAMFYQAFANGQPAALPELPIQYVDFAVWQRERLQGEMLEEQLTYWKKHLAGAPAALELPTDRPRLTVPTSRGSMHLFTLSKSLTDSLKVLSRQEGVSLFTTLVTAFQTLLHRYTGQDDLLLGTDVADRSQAETEDLIGFFVNTLVLRSNLSGNPTFCELLSRVREVILAAQAHQDLPIEHLVKELQPDRSLGQNPFFQVMLSLDVPTPLLPSGWVMTPLEIKTGAAKFDLSLEIQDRPQGLLTCLEYNTDLFDAATIVRLVEHWQTLLEGIVADPNRSIADLPLLPDAEWQQQVVEWNATQTAYPENQCFHELFEAQVERTPEAVAVVFEQEQLTYHELNSRANQLARYLQDLGVGPDIIVPLLAERGIAFLITILAVFKAGGAYLPLDPRHPPTRIRRVLEHSGSRFVLAAKGFASLLSQALVDMRAEAGPRVVYLEDLQFQNGHAEGNLPACVTPRNLAYVIYTSGSTGMPKGVMIEHRGMVNHLYAKITALHLTATDIVAQTASQCFDISVWQFLAALLVGGRVHIFNDEVSHDPVQLLAQVEQRQVSILETVPSLLRVMLEAIESGSSVYPRLEKLRWLVPTGEALPPEFCRRWLTVYPHIPLLNAYGPTECSDDVTHFPIYQPLADTQVHTPIGRPINNMRLYILDRKLRPLPTGVSGELYVGGIGVGRGYLNDVQRTTEAFVADPFGNEPGMRLYKTGDLARYLPDGNIEFLGRIDHQVKIRGYRIELGEIEALLRQHSSVQDIVVIVREDIPGDKSLVAYVVTSPGVTSNDLRSYLKEKLPDYMVPAAFVLLESLPLTPNGKVDRRALPAPEYNGLARGSERDESFVAPTLPVHQQLVQIWEELLDVRPIGIRDNFFELGGHSLLAVRLIDRMKQVWGKKIPPAILLAGPTIEQLATVLLEQEESDSRQPLFSEHKPLLSSFKTIWTRSRSSGRGKNSGMSGGNDK
jgi:amino acid adenylation domain-containing protein